MMFENNSSDFFSAVEIPKQVPILEVDINLTYKIGKKLGHGTYGQVHVATCLKDNKDYAVKTIKVD